MNGAAPVARATTALGVLASAMARDAGLESCQLEVEAQRSSRDLVELCGYR